MRRLLRLVTKKPQFRQTTRRKFHQKARNQNARQMGQTINHLPNPNKLDIGQSIMLKKEQILGFQALLLDADRNPIKGLDYQFEFAGRIIKGVTDLSGLTKKIMTVSPEDQVRILVLRLDKSLKQIATVASGYGNKLVTLVSPRVIPP